MAAKNTAPEMTLHVQSPTLSASFMVLLWESASAATRQFVADSVLMKLCNSTDFDVEHLDEVARLVLRDASQSISEHVRETVEAKLLEKAGNCEQLCDTIIRKKIDKHYDAVTIKHQLEEAVEQLLTDISRQEDALRKIVDTQLPKYVTAETLNGIAYSQCKSQLQTMIHVGLKKVADESMLLIQAATKEHIARLPELTRSLVAASTAIDSPSDPSYVSAACGASAEPQNRNDIGSTGQERSLNHGQPQYDSRTDA